MDVNIFFWCFKRSTSRNFVVYSHIKAGTKKVQWPLVSCETQLKHVRREMHLSTSYNLIVYFKNLWYLKRKNNQIIIVNWKGAIPSELAQNSPMTFGFKWNPAKNMWAEKSGRAENILKLISPESASLKSHLMECKEI